MHRRTSRSVLAALGVVVVVLAWHATTFAREPSLMTATLVCRPEAAPGRVLCELSVIPSPGARLTWVDALVTATPEFVRPLRSRVAAERFAGEGGRERKLSLAFIASGAGAGQVSVKARAVVCRGSTPQSECRPEVRELSAELRVGS